MEFLEMVTEVLSYLDNRSDISLDTVKAKLNENYKFLASPFRFREQESTATISTVVDQESYAVSYVEILSVKNTDTENKLIEKDIHWLEDQVDGAGEPLYWVPWGTNIILYPTPDDVWTIRLRVRALPTDMTADDDEPLMPVDWHKVLVLMSASDLAFTKKMRELGMLLRNEALGHLSTREEPHVKNFRNQQNAGFSVRRPRL